jgi:hypothetical protein
MRRAPRKSEATIAPRFGFLKADRRGGAAFSRLSSVGIGRARSGWAGLGWARGWARPVSTSSAEARRRSTGGARAGCASASLRGELPTGSDFRRGPRLSWPRPQKFWPEGRGKRIAWAHHGGTSRLAPLDLYARFQSDAAFDFARPPRGVHDAASGRRKPCSTRLRPGLRRRSHALHAGLEASDPKRATRVRGRGEARRRRA